MKTINTYINERLHITSKIQYSCQPKTKDELHEIIIQHIKDEGNECNLNDIDVSKIEDMSLLFSIFPNNPNGIFRDFNGDISMWDVSNVTNMEGMFNWCEKFNGDISKWNVSNVKNMSVMFNQCKNFNCDISKWNVSNVESMSQMFFRCEKFKQNLDKWNVSNVKYMNRAFYKCPTQPEWYDGDKYNKYRQI